MKVIRCKDCALDGSPECSLSYIEKQTLCFVEHSPMFFCGKAKPTEDYQPTNGDVIRNLTDRQLAEWLTELKELREQSQKAKSMILDYSYTVEVMCNKISGTIGCEKCTYYNPETHDCEVRAYISRTRTFVKGGENDA